MNQGTPGGGTINYSYSGGLLQTVSVVYDAFGRTEATIDALGHRVTTVFDSHGRAEATIDTAHLKSPC